MTSPSSSPKSKTEKPSPTPFKDTRPSFAQTLSNTWWVYKQIFKIAPIEATVTIVVVIMQSVIPTLSSLYIAKFIDAVIAFTQSPPEQGFVFSLANPLVSSLALVGVMYVLSYMSNTTNYYVDGRIQQYHLSKFQQSFYLQVAMLDIQQVENPAISDLIRKANDNLFKLGTFWNASVSLLVNVATVSVLLVVCLNLAPVLTFGMILLALPYSYIIGEGTRRFWRHYTESTEQRRLVSWLNHELSDEPTMLPEHKVTGSHFFLNSIAKRENDRYLNGRFWIINSRFYKLMGWTPMSLLEELLPLAYLAWRVLSGSLTIGQFTFYNSRFGNLSSTISRTLSQFNTVSDAASYVGYIKQLYTLKPSLTSGTHKVGCTTPPVIEFHNVSFKYPRSEKYVLRHLTMKINSGDEIAIVGENGAGKTTLIKLILRFYDPTEGDILINGTPLHQVSLESYYNTIGCLFQDFNTYWPLSVKNNILAGDSTRHVSMGAIRKAANMADASSFIDHLPFKYDQIIAKQFKKGIDLSTGQRQKLALARMFYRDRPVLILDEPTASIDAVAEYKIFQRIYKFMTNKTVIIISHRFSTVRNAQKIYVLHKGELVEQGSHAELIQKKGRYAKAFNLQAKGYQSKQ